MFASVRLSVLIAGYSFDHGEELFEPRYAAMSDRGVEARFYIDIREIDDPK